MPAPDSAFAEIDALPIDTFNPALLDFRPPAARVVAEKANVRGGPGTNYDKTGTLAAGDALRVLARFQDWYQAQRSDGQTIWIAADLLDLNPTAAFNNVLAPRVLRDVAGDFAAQVRVAAFERPKPKTSSNKKHSYVGAGLLVWHDEKNFIRLLRAANGDSGLFFFKFKRRDSLAAAPGVTTTKNAAQP